jgi:tetratricopeptide (TPR) repeat protein
MEHNTYLVKAIDAYPFDLEETTEALSYALSYEPNNGMALCLMGRLYMEIYQDYEGAISYFEKALEDNVKMHTIYGYYSQALLSAEEFDKAKTFLDFALTVKGSDKALLLSRKAEVFENKRRFSKAKKLVKEARLETYNEGFMIYLDDLEARIKKKETLSKPKIKKGVKGKKPKKK